MEYIYKVIERIDTGIVCEYYTTNPPTRESYTYEDELPGHIIVYSSSGEKLYSLP